MLADVSAGSHDAYDALLGLDPRDRWLRQQKFEAWEVRTVAYHEAGHAVVAISLGVPVKSIAAQEMFGDTGRCVLEARFGEVPVETLVLFLLAGGAAERRGCPEWRGDLGDRDDLEQARLQLTTVEHYFSASRSSAVNQSMTHWQTRARALVDREWAWISAVAAQLAARRWLSGDDILALRPGDAAGVDSQAKVAR